jgi:hypothetical protein
VEPSGPQWVARFPGSVSLDDLLPEFQKAVRGFLHALRDAGARVRIAATYRPPERAWLMHWSWLIARGHDPADVPHLKNVDIAWQHTKNGVPDLHASRLAAMDMVARYGIRYAPSLVSRHTQRRAIDMRITWKGPLYIRDAANNVYLLAYGPRTGLNHNLVDIAMSYGLRKLFSDPPHWSDDGH